MKTENGKEDATGRSALSAGLGDISIMEREKWWLDYFMNLKVDNCETFFQRILKDVLKFLSFQLSWPHQKPHEAHQQMFSYPLLHQHIGSEQERLAQPRKTTCLQNCSCESPNEQS